MLSGVGPAQHIASHSIPVIKDLSGVGSHLQDHLLANLVYRDKTNAYLPLAPATIWERFRLTWYIVRWSVPQEHVRAKLPLVTCGLCTPQYRGKSSILDGLQGDQSAIDPR